MHCYNYINTVPLLNIAKKLKYFIQYIILKISKLSLPASPGSTGAMAPDFSHKKGNHV